MRFSGPDPELAECRTPADVSINSSPRLLFPDRTICNILPAVRDSGDRFTMGHLQCLQQINIALPETCRSYPGQRGDRVGTSACFAYAHSECGANNRGRTWLGSQPGISAAHGAKYPESRMDSTNTYAKGANLAESRRQVSFCRFCIHLGGKAANCHRS